MNILVTNDDGYNAPGLLALKTALAQVGTVLVVAPEHNFSASGHVKTLHKPLRISEVSLADGVRAYAASGAPSDCVALVLLGALDFKPDLIFSGINPNCNLGHDVTYSGTVTAAMEGAIGGVPSVAVSTASAETYPAAADFAARLAVRVIEKGLPRGILLNVNVPRLPLHGVRITRMGQRVYRDELVVRHDPRGRPYYWIGGEQPSGVPDEGTDIHAIENGYISVTPIQLDLTAQVWIDPLQGWNLKA
ncbi:MAG TPA: 5'/3'-nucleotidase SurE [Anaerolineae bacterium]|nr:5'/3'-nucleotidase SurE [Anaerolineae bacterium]